MQTGECYEEVYGKLFLENFPYEKSVTLVRN